MVMALTWLETVIQWFLSLSNVAFGFLLGSIITGVFTWKVVVPKVMKNKKVEELNQGIQEISMFFKSDEYKELVSLSREGIKLFKEAIPILQKLLEHQENGTLKNTQEQDK